MERAILFKVECFDVDTGTTIKGSLLKDSYYSGSRANLSRILTGNRLVVASNTYLHQAGKEEDNLERKLVFFGPDIPYIRTGILVWMPGNYS